MTEVIEALKEPAMFLSLQPHVACVVVHGDMTVIPMDGGLEDVPNRILIHVIPYKNEDEQRDGHAFFQKLGVSPVEYMPTNSIIGMVERKKVFPYLDNEQWLKDAPNHFRDEPLDVFKMRFSWKDVWGLRVGRGQLLETPIFDVPAPDGNSEIWFADGNPLYEMVIKMSTKAPKTLVDDLLTNNDD